MIVLLGIINFLLVFAHAAHFKRPLLPRCHGLPFISTRSAFLVLDKHVAANAKLTPQPFGILPIRHLLYELI